MTQAQKEEVEKVRRELRFAQEKADNNEKSKGTELSALLSRHNREMTELEELLRTKQRALDELQSRVGDRDSDMERRLREKEEELEIFKAGMDQTLLDLNEMRLVRRIIKSVTSYISLIVAFSIATRPIMFWRHKSTRCCWIN